MASLRTRQHLRPASTSQSSAGLPPLRTCMRGEPEAPPSSGSREEQKPVAGPNFVTRAGRLLLSQRADFSTIGATGVFGVCVWTPRLLAHKDRRDAGLTPLSRSWRRPRRQRRADQRVHGAVRAAAQGHRLVRRGCSSGARGCQAAGSAGVSTCRVFPCAASDSETPGGLACAGHGHCRERHNCGRRGGWCSTPGHHVGTCSRQCVCVRACEATDSTAA